jgi:hypothetical protein
MTVERVVAVVPQFGFSPQADVAIGSLQLRRLLDPTLVVDDGEIDAQVERAMRIFVSFEGAV